MKNDRKTVSPHLGLACASARLSGGRNPLLCTGSATHGSAATGEFWESPESVWAKQLLERCAVDSDGNVMFLLRFSLVKDRVCRRLQRYYTLLALWKCRSACKVDHLLQSWPTANPFTTTADWFELSMGVSDNGVCPLIASENGKKYNKPGDLGEKTQLLDKPHRVSPSRKKQKQNLCRLHEIKSSVPDSNIIQTPGMFQFALSF